MLALPWLEAMSPVFSRTAKGPTGPTLRMGMFYFGTGMNMRQFYPEGFGKEARMSRILKPLEKRSQKPRGPRLCRYDLYCYALRFVIFEGLKIEGHQAGEFFFEGAS